MNMEILHWGHQAMFDKVNMIGEYDSCSASREIISLDPMSLYQVVGVCSSWFFLAVEVNWTNV